MNYFGHAAVASERREEPMFVLGAMLPDFAAMLRTTCPRSSDANLNSGVSFHLQTDAVFHLCPTFVALNREGLRTLRLAGVSSGPARAVAHMATEMLLDATLVARPSYQRSYLHALRQAAEACPELHWARPEDAESFAGLATHLLERGPAVHRGDPELIALRVGRALNGRRRLQPSALEAELIAQWTVQHALLVYRDAEQLLDEVRRGLAATE